MKFLQYHTYLNFLYATLFILALSLNSEAYSSQEEFRSLVDAIEYDDFAKFEALLQSGANPNFIGEELNSPIRWVNCMVARLRPLAWVKALETHGAYLGHVRTDYAEKPSDSKYASALFCSLRNQDMSAFVHIVKNDPNPTLELCHLCTNTFFKFSILEFAVRIREFEKAAWLLEHTNYAKDMISERMLSQMNKRSGITKNNRPHFWKAVDLIRDLGYEVNPAMTR